MKAEKAASARPTTTMAGRGRGAGKSHLQRPFGMSTNAWKKTRQRANRRASDAANELAGKTVTLGPVVAAKGVVMSHSVRPGSRQDALSAHC